MIISEEDGEDVLVSLKYMRMSSNSESETEEQAKGNTKVKMPNFQLSTIGNFINVYADYAISFYVVEEEKDEQIIGKERKINGKEKSKISVVFISKD
jgi:hypothetical protein